MNYHCICPECKNDINFEKDSLQEQGHFECSTCGITLAAQALNKKDDENTEIQEPEIVELEK